MSCLRFFWPPKLAPYQIQYDSRASTTQLPPKEHGWAGDPNVQTYFIVILSRDDGRFPLSLWCYLVRPAELTVNLLRQSNVTPKILAYIHVHGQHNYMNHPFTPLGCSVMAHIKPKQTYLGRTRQGRLQHWHPSMEHHQCFTIYIAKTRATRVSDAVFFKHQYITNPQIMP
jgi:hypothetical protein